MKPGLIFLLSGTAILLLASALLADDGQPSLDKSGLRDTSAADPGSMVGVRPSFSLEESPKARHAPLKAVLFSTAVPGAGQAWNGRWLKASAFVAVGALLVTRIAVEADRADRFLYLRGATTGGESDDYYYDRYSTHSNRRDQLVWWAIVFWAYNMFDAYIDGHLFGFSRQ
ncbi:MAG: DUF5683 domain-containing protein [bacterium]